MKSQHNMNKKRVGTLTVAGIVVGILGFCLFIYIGVMLYNRGIYVDEHHLGGYIATSDIVLAILALLLEVTSIIFVNVGKSRK